jgi:diadenosine tetraphosphate (Ap4A) HIT family hydrolase
MSRAPSRDFVKTWHTFGVNQDRGRRAEPVVVLACAAKVTFLSPEQAEELAKMLAQQAQAARAAFAAMSPQERALLETRAEGLA